MNNYQSDEQPEDMTMPISDVSGPAAAPPPTVLLADDGPDLLMLMMRQLTRAGYHVITAVDGAAALQMAKEFLPDIAVLDVQMPYMGGIDVLERLRTEPATMHIPVILISAGFAEHTVRRGLDAGADDYLKKPLERHQLAATIAKACQRRSRTDRPTRLTSHRASPPPQ